MLYGEIMLNNLILCIAKLRQYIYDLHSHPVAGGEPVGRSQTYHILLSPGLP